MSGRNPQSQSIPSSTSLTWPILTKFRKDWNRLWKKLVSSQVFNILLLISPAFIECLSFVLQNSDQTMVFGHKQSEDTLQKPALPNISQIIEDLQNADAQDPIFTLNPGELLKEESTSEASRIYDEVTAYVSKERQIAELQEKITSGFDCLVSGQGKLKQASAEVEQKLSKIKEDRKLISVAPRTEESQSEQSSEEDLC